MNTIEVFNPFDLSKVGEVARQSESQALALLEKSYSLFCDRAQWLPKHQRIAILTKAAELVESRQQDLAYQAAQEGGKPLTDSLVELKRAVEGIRVAVHELWNLSGETVPMGATVSSAHRLALTVREPRGVVLAISAFNHPFNLIVHQVVTAIAAGCPVLVKPSSATPLSCQSLVEILHEAGLPQDWCKMFITENAVTEKLVSDPRIAFFTFIGSAKVGWSLRAKLAPGTTCALEHGGVAPVILDRSADLEKAVPALVKGGYYHAGQVCVSVQRIFVHESIESAFLEKFVPEVQALKVGSALEKETQVGPLISPKEVVRVHDWVQDAVKKGAKVLCGGAPFSQTCYQPTVLLNPPDEAIISQQEVFGPVTCVYRVKDNTQAIKRANALPVSFQAAVFAQDLDAALSCANNLNALAVMINDHTAFRVDWMPFGGTKDSGLGLGGIPQTIEEMMIKKLIVVQSKGVPA